MAVRAEESSGGIPSYLADAFRELSERALDLSNAPYQPYPEQRFAPFPETLQDYLALSFRAEPELYFNRALAGVSRGTSRLPQQYDMYSEPYRREVASKLQESGNRNTNRFISELEKTFPGGPRSRNPGLIEEARREGQELARRRYEEAMGRGHAAISQGFGLDRARDLEAAGILDRLEFMRQASNLAEAQALRETGLLRHEDEQRRRDIAYEQWKEQERHPHESLAEYFNILRGVPYVRSSYERSEERQPYQSWHRGDWGGLGFDVISKLLSRGFSGEHSASSGGRRLSILPETFLSGASESARRASVAPGSEGKERKERKETKEASEAREVERRRREAVNEERRRRGQAQLSEEERNRRQEARLGERVSHPYSYVPPSSSSRGSSSSSSSSSRSGSSLPSSTQPRTQQVHTAEEALRSNYASGVYSSVDDLARSMKRYASDTASDFPYIFRASYSTSDIDQAVHNIGDEIEREAAEERRRRGPTGYYNQGR